MKPVRTILGIAVLCLSIHASAYADPTNGSADHSDGSTLFRGLAQTPEANLFTGALGTQIEIEVPPGRKNVTPKLALVYSSAGGPSPYGYGWDLPLGHIQRSTKWGVPQCTGAHTDDFALVMPNGTAELVADPPTPAQTTYRPKVEESYLEAQRDTSANKWVVYDRSGMKYTFGDAATARVVSTAPCAFTTSWALTAVEDPNGNTMSITYSPDHNALYPTNIDCGGNPSLGQEHFYHVVLSYNQRAASDHPESDLSGASVVLYKQLSGIVVTTDIGSQNLIRSYAFQYDQGTNGKNGYQSMLSSVSFGGSDGSQTYPTQVFTYEPGPNEVVNVSPAYTPPAGVTELRKTDSTTGTVYETLMDMNGDGITDLVKSSASGNWTVYFGNKDGSGFSSTPTTWTVVGTSMTAIRRTFIGGQHYTTRYDVFDVNGDGIPDFVDASPATFAQNQNQGWTVYLGTSRSINGGWGFGQQSQPSVLSAR